MIFISLAACLVIGSAAAVASGSYIVVCAAAVTFTPYVAFQQMDWKRRPKTAAVGRSGCRATLSDYSPASPWGFFLITG
jgi:hypothetical protein